MKTRTVEWTTGATQTTKPKTRQLQKPVGDLISRGPANKIQGGGTRDSSGKRRPWKSSRGAVGNRGKPWELPWENSGGAGETRGTGLELRTEVHTGGMTAGEHREGKNK